MTPTGNVDLDNFIELTAIEGPPGKESVIAEAVRGKLIEMGVPAEAITFDDANARSEIGGEIGNMIVRLDGHGDGPRRMIATHLDTVPPAVGCDPTVEGDRVVSGLPDKALGADARAGVAVLLAAARALCERNGDCAPVTLVFFVQEEIGLVGARWVDVSLLGEPAMCFNFDGGDPAEITNKVIGTERMHITVTGKACHTCDPTRGISAAAIWASAMGEMVAQGLHGRVEQEGGEPALVNLGVLEGGTGSNVVMPHLYGLLECRTHDKPLRLAILERWREAFRSAVGAANAAADEGVGPASVEFTQGPVYDPYELAEDHPAVVAAADAIRAVGLEPRCIVDYGGQDSAWIVAHGIPAIGLGFGCRRAHSIHEHLIIDEFNAACRLAVELATAE